MMSAMAPAASSSLRSRRWFMTASRASRIIVVPLFHGQEVAQQVFPGERHDRLGMKLDPFDCIFSMPDAHHHPTLASGGHLELLGNAIGLDGEGMVADGLEWIGQAGEYAAAVVFDG